ncbi:MAG TPA: hypothetical protein VIV65_08035 [Gemmatimonadaceae bacterium]|jgi:hypothetical protein
MMRFLGRTPPARALGRLAALIAATSVVAVAGCKDLTSIDASFDNVTDSLDFFMLNNSPIGTETAINLFTGHRLRADETFAYDIAFDMDSLYRIRIIPVRALATTHSSPYSVGLQKLTGASFAQVTDAPRTGYVADSVITVTVGDVVAIESHDVTRCGFAIKGSSYFSKLVVTSIDTAVKKISTVIEVNRNCGFHSFAEGKPKD